MAQLFPELTVEQLAGLTSRGEAAFYQSCKEQLDNSWRVLYSISWISRQPSRHAQDGETDFLLFSETSGLLLVEVKGGGVRFNASNGRWNSFDFFGTEHEIKDPFAQVRNARYALLSKLREQSEWQRIGPNKLIIGYAVAFPDISGKTSIVAPDRPGAIIAVADDLKNLSHWITGVLRWWQNSDPGARPLDKRSAEIVLNTFARSFLVKPLVADRIYEEEKRRITLTMQQARLLRALGARRRVAIKGGAGTGKTLLAMEKARQLAREGFRTLLVCYNRPLGKHLRECCGGESKIEAFSFHQFCGDRINRVYKSSGRNLLKEARAEYPGADFYQVLLPYALALAVEASGETFDAIVVDEGQDFRQEFWLPLEMLLSDSLLSPFYIFYDNNQSLYCRPEGFPIQEHDEFELTVNCRNTRAIHDVAYHYYHGVPTDPPDIEGVSVQKHHGAGMVQQARSVATLISRMIHEEQVIPGEIVVLITDPLLKGACMDLLKKHALPRGCHWLPDTSPQTSAVRVESVHRFKGLEAAIVIIWGIDNIDPNKDRETLYVALSRPRSELHLVGSHDKCQQVLSFPG